jgi:hypothetical protein
VMGVEGLGCAWKYGTGPTCTWRGGSVSVGIALRVPVNAEVQCRTVGIPLSGLSGYQLPSSRHLRRRSIKRGSSGYTSDRCGDPCDRCDPLSTHMERREKHMPLARRCMGTGQMRLGGRIGFVWLG